MGCPGDWPTGTVGRVLTQHRSDGDYSARARLLRDSPANGRSVRVELLEDFYCCEAGEEIRVPRRLFVPDAQQSNGG